MNRKLFYDSVRKSFGPLVQRQVDGFAKILDEAERRGTQLKRLAYMLATTWHETDKEMQPIREKGSEKYLKTKKYYPWVGEGLVQVTWEENHRKFGATKPGQLMTWPIALRALFDGMEQGRFTSFKLADFINGEMADYRNARKVVNGLDDASLIAGHATKFAEALTDSGYGKLVVVPPVEPPVIPPKEPYKPSIQLVGVIIAALMAVIGAIAAFFGLR